MGGPVGDRRSAIVESGPAAFHKTFREIHPLAMRLVRNRLDRKDRYLREMLKYALEKQRLSEYGFVLKYCFCRKEREGTRIRKFAAAAHLLQTSTFISDDIFDRSDLRYGRKAIYVKYGVSYAILAAELLQSIALEILSAELARGKFAHAGRVIQLFHEIVTTTYLSQFIDLYTAANPRVTPREYYRGIALGPARFLANLAQSGALLAGKPPGEVERLARFGYHYGMGLFITDDIVDIVSEPGEGWKSFASDLKGQRMRLPMILALRQGSRRDTRFLKGFLTKTRVSNADVHAAAKVIRNSGALEACRAIARGHLNRALDSISGMEPSLTTKNLRWLCESLFAAQGIGHKQHLGVTRGRQQPRG